jgi:hypothetical protein
MTYVLAMLCLDAIFGVALIVSSLRDVTRAEARVVPEPVESGPPPIRRRQSR